MTICKIFAFNYIISNRLAINLVKMEAIRNECHRIPCPPDDERFWEFERNFTYTPTTDQLQCFKVDYNKYFNHILIIKYELYLITCIECT